MWEENSGQGLIHLSAICGHWQIIIIVINKEEEEIITIIFTTPKLNARHL